MAPHPAEAGDRPGRVELSGLTWRPHGRRDPVLRDIDLAIPPGQRVLLVGPSGSGKSTLLRAIAGLLETADSGELTGTALIDGVAPGERAGSVGLVLQEPGAGVVAATVGRDVAFGPENIGLPREEMPARVAGALSAVELTMPQDTPTHALSGGETQRLALAGALALSPAVLLLDEPTAMLDPDNAAAVRAVVDEVSGARDLTTVVVEHVLGPWVPFADRLLVLSAAGSIVADGDPQGVLAEHGPALAAAGIWVPGVPSPTPMALPDGLFPTLVAGRAPIDSTPLTIRRRVRTVRGEVREHVAARTPALALPAGTVHALVGPSGAGKSSALLAHAGLLEDALGADERVTVTDLDGRAVDLPTEGPHPLGVAWVPQWSSSTIVARTVIDECLTTSRAAGVPDAVARPRAEALLEAVGLTRLAGSEPRHLSGGEQRRLALVAAVVHHPRLLLLDEPTVGQDRLTWAAVVGIVDALTASGTAVEAATHDATFIARADGVTRLVPPPRKPEATAPRLPLAARCGPLALLAASALAIPAGVAAGTIARSVLVLGLVAALAVLALWAPRRGSAPGAPAPSGRFRGFALRLVPGLIGALSVGWSSWLLGGRDVVVAVEAFLRVLIIVAPSALLIPFVDPDELGDHAGQRLHLPARPVVATSAALQRITTFGEIWAEISRARRVRGLSGGRGPRALLRTTGAITVGMLIRSLHAAAALAVAMDARGFATAQRRTWAGTAPWRRADSILVGLALLVVAVAVLAPR
ncbi:ATP-binding cassette domain-containing protein [Janibacter sp. G56]|uniref:ATP-binding cassette domain-containing protein n=1 Tax=Janibacter sp. G56 TaxID=3418717 RepID=UPI003D025BB3